MSKKIQIEKRMRTKTNSILANAIVKLKKTNLAVAQMLATPKKKWLAVNLEEINKIAKDGDKILVAGKLLGNGAFTKKVKIVAWNASEAAREKIKKAKSEFATIAEEIKKNPQLKDLKLVK